MSETKTTNSSWHVSHGEHFKSLFDYLKHLSTLATGSILLIATFLEKLFKEPLWSWCVGISVSALFLSLVASLVAYSITVLNFPRNDHGKGSASMSELEKNLFAGGIIITWLSFLIGIGTMALFFLVNWFGH